MYERENDTYDYEYGIKEALTRLDERLHCADGPVPAIQAMLQTLSEYYGAEKAYIIEVDFDAGYGSATYEWCAEGAEPRKSIIQYMEAECFPQWKDAFDKKEPIIIPNVDAIKEVYFREYEFHKEHGVSCVIAIPFVVYYRIKEKAIFPNPHNDLKRAVSCILSHADEWNIEKDGWSLWGSSAGGHLASSYCTDVFEAPKPAALILSYPVITMGEHTHERSKNKLLGKKPDSSLIELLSVENHITSHYPPTYLWYGTADASVDPKNSRMMDAALDRAGVPHETEGFAEIGHGVGLAKGTDAEKWLDHAIAFWEKQRRK